MKKILYIKSYALFLTIPAFTVLLTTFCALKATAQSNRAVPGEMVLCNIKVADEMNPGNNQKSNSVIKVPVRKEIRYKNYQPQLNQLGLFDKILNLAPMQVVPIELLFPNGTAGEEVVVTVIDGGSLENGVKGKAEQLNNQKQLAFNFQVGKDLGLYRIVIKKGTDSKVIQLWVGAEQKTIK